MCYFLLAAQLLSSPHLLVHPPKRSPEGIGCPSYNILQNAKPSKIPTYSLLILPRSSRDLYILSRFSACHHPALSSAFGIDYISFFHLLVLPNDLHCLHCHLLFSPCYPCSISWSYFCESICYQPFSCFALTLCSNSTSPLNIIFCTLFCYTLCSHPCSHPCSQTCSPLAIYSSLCSLFFRLPCFSNLTAALCSRRSHPCYVAPLLHQVC